MSDHDPNAPRPAEGAGDSGAAAPGTRDKVLFWACVISLISTSTAFIVRVLVMPQWSEQFGLTNTQEGQLFGVGLWPFAVSIVLFSLVIDRIGYGRAMVFAFLCHIGSTVILLFAQGFWWLWAGTFIVALGNGTAEAAVNPVVATMFPKEKTKWLSILHAGWPAGLVFAGIVGLLMDNFAVGEAVAWQWKIGLVFVPTLIYGAIMLGRKFPVHERVAAGVPYREMLAEVGILGALIVAGIIVWEITTVIAQLFNDFGGGAPHLLGEVWVRALITVLITIPFALYVRALGRPLFIILLLAMIPLATTELGTDSWISDLMAPAMNEIGLAGGWVLVYTSFIMMVLRLNAGPIVKVASPLGLLAMSAAIGAIGLVALSWSAGVWILAAATLYGFGKSFLWPGTLGLVAEQSPRGGALTLNTIAGVGMLSVGVLGNPFLGNIQDRQIDENLAERAPQIHDQVMGEPLTSVFGSYQALVDNWEVHAGPEEESTVNAVQTEAKKDALLLVAILPTGMLIVYICLIAYFRSKGGYQAEELTSPGGTEKHDPPGSEGHEEEYAGGTATASDK